MLTSQRYTPSNLRESNAVSSLYEIGEPGNSVVGAPYVLKFCPARGLLDLIAILLILRKETREDTTTHKKCKL